MKMSDKEFDNLIKETMRWEADCIMEEVESDPKMKDVVAPESIHEKLMKQIEEKKEKDKKKQESHKRLTPEEQELIRLGMKYRKNSGKGKYFILVAAIVCALGVGTISIGGKKNVFSEVKRMLSGREQTLVNTGDDDRHINRGDVSEQNAYEQINEEFGFYPVQLYYLPEGVEFAECVLEEEAQNARLYYEGKDNVSISYLVVTNHRDGSTNIDVEDELVDEYEKVVNETVINIQEYVIEDNHKTRWMINFNYESAQYSMVLTGVEEADVEKVVENLFFS